MEKEFIAMINMHRGILFKVCNLYLNEEEDKKDLFQEIVLQLWKSYGSFRNESKQSTWMYRVALNCAISHFRKDRRKPVHEPVSRTSFLIPDFLDGPEMDERLRVLHQAIGRLTKIEKALIMCYLEDKTYQEISEIIGISPGNVGVKLNRIKTKLEKIINTLSYEHN